MENEQKQTEKELEAKTSGQNSKPKTKKCKHCATEIPMQAKVCPNCRKKQNGGCLTIVLIIIGIIIAFNIFIFIISGVLAMLGVTTNDLDKAIDNIDNAMVSEGIIEPTTTTEKEVKKPIEVDITTMFEELDENALNAKDKYENQYIKVSGKVFTIDSDGKYFSIIEPNKSVSFDSIRIRPTRENKDLLKTLKSDNIITVIGTIKSVGEISGYSMTLDKIEQ